MKDVMDIALWIIIGSAVVLIITNASNFAVAVTSVGQFATSESQILAGQSPSGSGGYVKKGG